MAEKHWHELRDEDLAAMNAARRVQAKTKGQEVYLRAVETSTITLCSGPAGSGKTFVPCGLAAQMLREGRVAKIVLTRPLVACDGGGPGLGFLKGNLMEKISPYMRPMLDVLEHFLGHYELEKNINRGVIELVPLELMRGMSIDDAVVIADEMQNSEPEQFLMLLTRVGQNTRLVAAGDLGQTDLPGRAENGLRKAFRCLRDEPDIAVVRLTEKDIVRHGIVRRILELWR